MNRRLAAMALVAAAGAWHAPEYVMAQSGTTAPPQAPVGDNSAAINSPAINLATADPGELTDSNSKFFESEAAGISLRIPAGCRNVPASGVGDDIGQYADQIRKWEIKLQRTTHPEATDLLSSVDHDGKPVIGLLDKVARGLRLNLAGFIVRQDVTNIADPGMGANNQVANVGMIAVRYTSGGGRYLMQQALVRSSPRTFFSISLTTPIGEGKIDAEAPTALEVTAVKTFNRILDSVHLLDTAGLKHEQEARLARAQILLTQLRSRSRIQSAMLDNQWIRVTRNGRDVGYSYITEQNAAGPLKSGNNNQNKGDGLLIGIRGRTIIPPQPNGEANVVSKPLQMDAASWWYLSEDQNQEEWSRVTVSTELGADGKPTNPVKQQQYTDFGSTGIEYHRQIDHDAVYAPKKPLPGERIDAQQPPVMQLEQRYLDGTTIDPTGASKPSREPLPTLYYLPEALSTMLPRLLPLRSDVDNTPRTYMFLTYVVDNDKLMSRYVDVGDEGDFDLGGERIHAIPITDRLGWHGSITTHYVSPSGVYIGSENKDTHTITRVATAEQLMKIWKNADLTQPGAIERPKAAAASTARREQPASIDRNSQSAEVQGPPRPVR